MHRAAVPAALVVGGVLGFLARPILTPAPTAGPAADGPAAGPDPAAGAAAAIPSPSAIVGGGKTDRKTRVTTDGPVTVTSSETKLPETIQLDFEAIAKQMQSQQEAQDARKIALELAQLKTRLGLPAGQEQGVRELLEARAAQRRDGVSDLLRLAGTAGEDPAEAAAAAIAATAGDTFEADLAALLEPDQRSAYEGYRAERRANAIEAAAARELASLQSMLSLTDDQKDRAFEAFTEIAAEEIDASGGTPEDGFAPLDQMLAGGPRRRDALEPILTPEQMEIYRNSPRVGTGAVLFGPGGESIGEGSVISTFRIETAVQPAGENPPVGPPPAAGE